MVFFYSTLQSNGTLTVEEECPSKLSSSEFESSISGSRNTTFDGNAEEDDPPEQAVIIVGGNNGCDESKCVSTGLSFIFKSSFTCYFIEEYDKGMYDDNVPMICADGYQPQIVENEAIVYDNWGTPNHYFTCCPPNLLFDDANHTSVRRHCSNQTTVVDSNNTMICEDHNRPYPRPMKNKVNNEPGAYGIVKDNFNESHICCDSMINTTSSDNNQTTNFLNDIECVPYQNANDYEITYMLGNLYGRIRPIRKGGCNESEIGFQYLNKQGECCKKKPKKTIQFVDDIYFKTTVYPQIILSSVAVMACTILIVALLLPLWVHLRVKSAAANVTASTTRATNRRLQQVATASTYTGYNLYLVYLAIPDFFLNLYLLGMYGSYANQQYNPDFFGLIIYVSDENDGHSAFECSFALACSTANLYLNCVVSYELLVLLRNSDQFVSYNPPSLLRVTLQAVGVYLFSTIVFLTHFFIEKKAIQAYIDHEDGIWTRLTMANVVWSVIVSYVFPIGFFFYIWMTIRYHGYLPSVTEKTRQLVRYEYIVVYLSIYFFCI